MRMMMLMIVIRKVNIKLCNLTIESIRIILKCFLFVE